MTLVHRRNWERGLVVLPLLSAVLVLAFGFVLVVEGPGCAPCPYLAGGSVSEGRASGNP
jgi:hypothetical protein